MTETDLATRIDTSGKRALPYMPAAYTGLRRGKIQKLTLDDLHLGEDRPYNLARASIKKKKRRAAVGAATGHGT
ncbi:MAG TPA: hypothetical protein VMH30_07970 [Verrucomicrobiae bacterium]|nr:hypothetical protein [Verrucomicrobiae bacterium]